MKKFIVVLVLIIGCYLYLFTNVKQVIFPISSTIQHLVTPGPVEILPNPVTIVLAMKELSRFETASLTLEKIIPASRDMERFGGVFGEKILFVAHGEAIAGVDLETIQENDVQIININTAKVRLPHASIFNVILNNDESYVASRDKGLLAQFDPQLESKVRVQSQKTLEQSALDSDILESATKNAQNKTRIFLQKFGLKNIEFF